MSATVIPFPCERARQRPPQTPVPNRSQSSGAGISEEERLRIVGLMIQSTRDLEARAAKYEWPDSPDRRALQGAIAERYQGREPASVERLEQMILERIAQRRADKTD